MINQNSQMIKTYLQTLIPFKDYRNNFVNHFSKELDSIYRVCVLL